MSTLVYIMRSSERTSKTELRLNLLLLPLLFLLLVLLVLVLLLLLLPPHLQLQLLSQGWERPPLQLRLPHFLHPTPLLLVLQQASLQPPPWMRQRSTWRLCLTVVSTLDSVFGSTRYAHSSTG